ncbi:sensor histidine kinase [Salinibacterium sp.]|uniref:sensor histidine kinase n=1 Tax=Salinibacterium sp. TaxID=1915057 RepID=UPI00286BF80D|nr:sensor histidine kinase [Salinibacterium sp.]
MTSNRWWNIAVPGIAVVLIALLLVSTPTTFSLTGGLLCIAAFVIAWFTLGRCASTSQTALAAFIPLLIVISAAAAGFETAMATIQCVAYPLIWVLIQSTRRAVIANVMLAVAIGIGIYLGTGSLVVALVIEAASLAFALALGSWITSIANQSEERLRLLGELRTAQEQLSIFDRDAGVSSERERLAREIHDTIAQDLTGLVMLAQRAQRELSSRTSPSATLSMLEEGARTALAETRALVASGTPVALSGGISGALQRLGERFARETGMEVSVSASGLPELDRDTEVVVLRCAQEGLANVRKHSAGCVATVSAWAHNGSVALRVTDDGTGFDQDAPTSGFGLDGMRSRLALVGGTLDISSSPAGTVLTATLPLGVTA